MTTVQKVTISVPPELLERVEEHRHRLGLSRSEVMVDLMWRGWREAEHAEREERHRRAYAVELDGGGELSWPDMAAEELFSPKPTAQKKRRAAR